MNTETEISRRNLIRLIGATPLVLAGCGTELPEAPRVHAATIYDPFWYWFDHHYYLYYDDDDDVIEWRRALLDYWDGLSEEEKQEASEKVRGWVAANRPGLEGREEIITALSDGIRDTARKAWNDLSPAEKTQWRRRLDAARKSGSLPGVVEDSRSLGTADQLAPVRAGEAGASGDLSASDRARISDAIRASREARLSNRKIQRVSPPQGSSPRPVSRIPRSRRFGRGRRFGGGRGRGR